MSQFHNRTRQSVSIPRRLLREGKFHLIPVYYLMQTSELAREGIKNSGSYRFADHIYQGRPQGKFLIGYFLDALLLRLKSARSFRARHLYAKAEIKSFIQNAGATQRSLDILSVPCGVPRELFEAAETLKTENQAAYENVKWSGLDLDEALIHQLRQNRETSQHHMAFWSGDALSEAAYPIDYDLVISMGFTDFLDDEGVLHFYQRVYNHLKPGGRFITSGMQPHRFADYLLRNVAELHTVYRSGRQLRRLCQQAGFKQMTTYSDVNQLLTMLIAGK